MYLLELLNVEQNLEQAFRIKRLHCSTFCSR